MPTLEYTDIYATDHTARDAELDRDLSPDDEMWVSKNGSTPHKIEKGDATKSADADINATMATEARSEIQGIFDETATSQPDEAVSPAEL